MDDMGKEVWMYGIWFVDSAERNKDWMAYLYKDDGKCHISYRHRYYRTKGPWDGKDKKNWHGYSSKDDSDESLKSGVEAMHFAAEHMAKEYGGEVHFVLMECLTTDPKFFFELASQPWAHVKQMSKEEAIAQGYLKEADDGSQPGTV